MPRKKKEVIPAVELADSTAIEATEANTVKKIELSYDFAIKATRPVLIDAIAAGKTALEWKEMLEEYKESLVALVEGCRGEAFKNFEGIKTWAKALVAESSQKELIATGTDVSVKFNAVGVLEATIWSFVRAFTGGKYHGRLKPSHIEAAERAKKTKGAKRPDLKGLYDFLGAKSKGIQKNANFANEDIEGKAHFNFLAVDKKGSMYKFADALFSALEHLKYGTVEGDNAAIALLKSQAGYTGINPVTLALLVHSCLIAREINKADSDIFNYQTNYDNARTPQDAEQKKQLQQIMRAAAGANRK